MTMLRKPMTRFLIFFILVVLVNIASFIFDFHRVYFVYALFLFGSILYFLIFSKHKHGFWFELPKYTFLFLLLLITFFSLHLSFINNTSYLKTFTDFLSNYQIFLTVVTIITGALVFWMNGDVAEKVEEEKEKKRYEKVEEEEKEEENAEKKRHEEFDKKFPKIAKIWGLKHFIGWMYKEGWWYSLGLIAVVILAFFIFSHGIGSYEFRQDEFQVVSAAAGYYHTGHFYSWNWLDNKPLCNDLSNSSCVYARAWPHSFLIAQSYKIFGISEWSSRIVSVLFGLIFIISAYFIIRFFTGNKLVSLLTISTFISNPFFIGLFRYTRMYAVLLPIFLIMFYMFYRGITEKNQIHFKPEKLNTIINKNLNFNYPFLISAFILLVFNYLIHINSLIILPVLFLFLIYLAIFKKERKYIIFSLIGLLGFLIVFLVYFFGLTTKFLGGLSFFRIKNYDYLKYLTQFPFFKELNVLLLSVGLVLLFTNKKRKDKLMYFYLTIGFSLVFFIWIGNRYPGNLYISHIVAMSIIMIIFVYSFLIKLFDKKVIKIFLYLLLFFFLCLSFYNGFDSLYRNKNDYGRYNEAYTIIKENFNSEEQVIFGQYLRTYYLQGLPENIRTIDMRNKKNYYTYEEFIDDLSKYESGWIAWEIMKDSHLIRDVKNYISKNFKHVHGTGIDNTNVNVYYFNRSMIR